MFDLILKGGTCATTEGIVKTDVGIIGGKIAEIGTLDPAQARCDEC